MTLNYRVAGDPNSPMYSPERDLAYVFPALVQEVFATLDAKNWDDVLRYLNTEHGVTESMLAEGCGKFAELTKSFLRDASVKDLNTALEAVQFRELPKLVQLALFYRFGQAAAAGTLIAAKTLTPQFRDGGLQQGVASTAAAMYQAARQLVQLPQQTELAAPTVIDQAAYWQARAEMAEKLVKQQTQEIDRLTERITAYESQHGNSSDLSTDSSETGVSRADAN